MHFYLLVYRIQSRAFSFVYLSNLWDSAPKEQYRKLHSLAYSTCFPIPKGNRVASYIGKENGDKAIYKHKQVDILISKNQVLQIAAIP